ncbi:MAG: nicotinate-nucleotide--dimethylbenzimidazole phosphoribosyltransferase [Chloroflexota bacterium]|nr:nicotinate-nucleotide--dimethylbenzimidazole phosphoribosyltransferase [Chloroflexota bacterium]
MQISKIIDAALAQIDNLDEASMASARDRQSTLTKPLGSLGKLEELSILLAGIFSHPMPKITKKTVILAAGDHGVVAEGVSAYPQEVTPQMVYNFLSGGAAINVLSKHAGADIIVLDAGVAADMPSHPLLRDVKIGRGTNNIAHGPAMTRDQAIQCLETGIQSSQEAIDNGSDLIACGDMGIGNTTPSSAITSVITNTDPYITTGRGTGVDDSGLEKKVDAIKRAVHINNPDKNNGLDILTKIGGFEIGVLSGVMLGAASRNRPVIIDGFISGAAALIAWTISPNAKNYFIAAHKSVEPGHTIGLRAMDLDPLLDMEMRLGEGTGAVLAIHIIEAAAKCLTDMATFAEAGVAGKSDSE